MDDKCLTTYPVVNSFTTTSYSCSIIARPISDSTASNTSRFAETPHPNSIYQRTPISDLYDHHARTLRSDLLGQLPLNVSDCQLI